MLATGRGLRTLAGRPAGDPPEGPVTDVAATGGRFVVVVDGERIVAAAPDGPWEPVAERPAGDLRCVAQGPGGLLAGTAEAELLRLTDGRLEPLDSFRTAPTRADWHTPWGGPAAVRSLATDGTRWYVNVHVGGILRAEDPAGDWRATIDLATDVHEVTVDRASGTVLAACGAGGLAVSTNRGEDWQHHTGGLHATYCRAVAVTGDHVLVSASDGPRPGRAAVYRRPLAGGEPFRPCPGLPDDLTANVDTGCLAADGPVAIVALPDDRVMVSDDAGAGWRIAAEVPDVRAVALLGPD